MGGTCSTYGKRRGVYRGLVGKPDGKNHLEDPGIDGRIILEGFSGSGTWGHGLDRSGSGQGEVAGT